MKVSVLTPVYNPPLGFMRCLRSVENQVYQNIEHIIVDDGSTEGVENYLSDLKDSSHIKLIRLESNRGRGYARNRAVDEAEGEFVTMVDADDWIFPEKIERQVRFLQERPSIDVVSCAMVMVANEEILGVENYGHHEDTSFERMRYPSNINIPHAPCMIRSAIAKRIQYSAKYRSSEDLDFLLRLLFECDYGFISEPLYVYYCENTKSSLRAREQLRATRSIFSEYMWRFPSQVTKLLAESYLKQIFYLMLNKNSALKKRFFEGRYASFLGEERERFGKILSVLEGG